MVCLGKTDRERMEKLRHRPRGNLPIGREGLLVVKKRFQQRGKGEPGEASKTGFSERPDLSQGV